MAFTLVTLTGSYGANAQGQLTFTLTAAMANADALLVPQPIIVPLTSGAFSKQLQANTDTATLPQGVMWGVTEQVLGAQPRDYFIEIPGTAIETAGATTLNSNIVQLSTLTALPWMVGVPITGPGIPASTTVQAIFQSTNQLQLSNAATATATGVTLTITASTVDISTLVAVASGWT